MGAITDDLNFKSYLPDEEDDELPSEEDDETLDELELLEEDELDTVFFLSFRMSLLESIFSCNSNSRCNCCRRFSSTSVSAYSRSFWSQLSISASGLRPDLTTTVECSLLLGSSFNKRFSLSLFAARCLDGLIKV